jgi:hypothetical protein
MIWAGPRLTGLREARDATNIVLHSALATELEAQANRLEAHVPAQQEKEAKALTNLGTSPKNREDRLHCTPNLRMRNWETSSGS